MAETRQSRTASQKFMPVYIVASCGSGHKKKIPVSELSLILAEDGCKILSMHEQDETLESYYINLVGGGKYE